MAELALTNAAPGGHVLSIQPGIYNELVALTGSHAGVSGNPNTILATGAVVIDAQYARNYGVSIIGATAAYRGVGLYIEKSERGSLLVCSIHNNNGDGMQTGGGLGTQWQDLTIDRTAIFANSGDGAEVASVSDGGHFANCLVYDNTREGINYGVHPRANRVRNCTIYGNGLSGISVHNTAGYFVNNILARNGGYGIQETYTGASVVSNNCVNANTNGVYYDYNTTTIMATAAELNAPLGTDK